MVVVLETALRCAGVLDLGAAWQRVKDDITRRVLVRFAFEEDLIGVNAGAWLAALEEKVARGAYTPQAAAVFVMPKAHGAVRFGNYLTLEDYTVYSACVGAALPHIVAHCADAGPQFDFAQPLDGGLGGYGWAGRWYRGWQDFGADCRARLSQPKPYVVFADIASFYENVDIGELISILEIIGTPAEVVNLLDLCLRRWAHFHGRGLPVGYSASDILAKLYLSRLDNDLRDMSYEHCRYVDDIRIFCNSIAEARHALIDLAWLCRCRGLELQTNKTEILSGDAARRRMTDAVVLTRLTSQYVDHVKDKLGTDDALTFEEARRMVRDAPALAPRQLVRRAYDLAILYAEDRGRDFDKTAFRFLLRLLSGYGDDYAVGHVKGLLLRRPEETPTILSYLGDLAAYREVENEITDFLTSEDAAYDYQVFLVLEWLCDWPGPPSSALVAAARKFCFAPGVLPFVRSVARKFIGKFGDRHDLELLKNNYQRAGSELERAEIICALKRMDAATRDQFLADVAADAGLVGRAAKLASGINCVCWGPPLFAPGPLECG